MPNHASIYLSRWGNRGRRFKRGARELKGANKKLEPADLKLHTDGHGASHRRSSWTGMTLGVKPRLASALIVTLALALTFQNL